MHGSSPRDPGPPYVLDAGGGRRYLIYNARAIGNPFDHAEDRWYCLPYPVPLGTRPGQGFPTALDAEHAAVCGAASAEFTA